jgi:alpha-1,3-mannosyl-glycoprotein beta-1,2-N-acetylglucosaminyltransferase
VDQKNSAEDVKVAPADVKVSDAKKPSDADSKKPPDMSDVIPVLMFACNRVTVNKALDSLLRARKDPEKFPIIVSQVREAGS